MLSKVQIASQALIELGSEPISSFDERVSRPDLISIEQKIDTVINDILSRHMWSFATRRAMLTKSANAPAFGWDDKFLLPSDRLRGGPIHLWNTPDIYDTQLKEFAIEDGHVLCNEETLYCRYVYPAQPGDWPPYVDQVMVKALAADCARPVTDETNTGVELKTEAFGTPQEQGMGGLLLTAITLDSQMSPPESFEDFPLVAVRN